MKEIYNLKKEFFTKYNISVKQWERRKDELLEWLENFFDYKINEQSKPIMIEIYEQYGEYQPLPRKVSETNKEQKVKDYEEFTIKALGPEFKPNSKAKVARDAIAEFGYEKYGHTYDKAVAERFVTPAFEKYGEKQGPRIWVWYRSYQEPEEAIVEDWRNIMRKHKIDEAAAAKAFYK